jgi:membrane-associated protease RseP (regulator of RpoE activity)
MSLVLAGLVAGLAIAFFLQPGPQPPDAAAPRVGAPGFALPSATVDARADERLLALEDALDAEILQRAALEDRVAELAAQLEALGERPRFARDAGGSSGQPPANVEEIRQREQPDRRTVEQQRERRMIDRLTAAGFAPDRAEWIERREEELRMKALQEQYDARREGRPPAAVSGEASLRTELGDADYERYLAALGRPTSVGVADVLASSPAERAGLLPGDEIVAYNGKRVFDASELNALTLEGTPGETVVVDVRRDGQNMQLVMPRGPIGIFGRFRGR